MAKAIFRCVVVLVGVCSIACYSALVLAEKSLIPLEKVKTDIDDPVSLQRGAQLYINNCLGCHGIKYERYSGLAKGIGITDEAGDVLDKVVKENLLVATDKITDPIDTAMQASDAEKWFGTVPPDLSLAARVRGKDWLYTYLKSFYRDPNRPWGVNNLVFPDVAMPHVLLSLQGEQELRAAAASVDTAGSAATVGSATTTGSVTASGSAATQSGRLELVVAGTMTPAEYDQAVTDLVNFMSYVAEPVQTKRKNVGVLVLVILAIFLVFSYLLKREYWKDVH